MDAMKDALNKRKNAIQHNLKISIEMLPGNKGDFEKHKAEESEKKLGLAPEVKDAKSPKEPKLIPPADEKNRFVGADEVELGSRPESPEEEDTESPQERLAEGEIADLAEMAARKAMPEAPIGREPKSLHEKALSQMKKHPAIMKNTFKK